MFTIGPYKFTGIETGRFKLDGGAMFGVVPKPIWERTNPSDNKNRIDLAARALLLEGNNHRILIEAGVGTKFDEKNNTIYGVDHSQFTLEQSLTTHGLSTVDITDVFCTHLHFDHAGGNTFYDLEGLLQLRFPNAIYHVNRFHYEWAINPSRRDRASFFPENYEFIAKKGHLRLFEPTEKLFENCTLIPVHGHTPHQTLLRFYDDEKTLLHSGDMIPTSSHVPLPFVMGYDLNALQTLSEKEILLFDAAKEDWFIFFGHDPQHSLAKVQMTEKEDFKVTEKLGIF